MKAFADLYASLDETNKTNEKIAAMVDYFRLAQPEDAAWAVYFLSGRKPRQIVMTRKLVAWAIEVVGVAEWLFGESYDAVGDMAETLTLLLPETGVVSALPLHIWVEQRLLPVRAQDDTAQRAAVLAAWAELSTRQRFIYNKLITGSFRVGVSQLLVIRALSFVGGVDTATLAHRLMGMWEPTAAGYRSLLAPDAPDDAAGRPYPFCLAYPIEEGKLDTLGEAAEWQAEWKWDGIRSQLIKRKAEVFLWSRGEELVTDRYPEIAAAGALLPDGTVLDGELLPWHEDRVMPFAQLQRRIGRKTLTKKMLAEIPVIFMAYDVLESEGRDLRGDPMSSRRAALDSVIAAAHQTDAAALALRLSPLVEGATWDTLTEARRRSRELFVEGLMLKRRTSPYKVGRQRGDWWKWKIEPYTVDAVLINAQRGSGKRASLYSDYTFGVWDDGGQLVPFTKAYSGLTDAEIRDVDRFVRQHTVEKFGPVRAVTPILVFELGFEGLQRSARHKSGIAVRFPRMLRWRQDKAPEDADSLETIRALLAIAEGARREDPDAGNTPIMEPGIDPDEIVGGLKLDEAMPEALAPGPSPSAGKRGQRGEGRKIAATDPVSTTEGEKAEKPKRARKPKPEAS